MYFILPELGIIHNVEKQFYLLIIDNISLFTCWSFYVNTRAREMEASFVWINIMSTQHFHNFFQIPSFLIWFTLTPSTYYIAKRSYNREAFWKGVIYAVCFPFKRQQYKGNNNIFCRRSLYHFIDIKKKIENSRNLIFLLCCSNSYSIYLNKKSHHNGFIKSLSYFKIFLRLQVIMKNPFSFSSWNNWNSNKLF